MTVMEFQEKWYSEKRIKLSLGGMSPLQYRRSFGVQNAHTHHTEQKQKNLDKMRHK